MRPFLLAQLTDIHLGPLPMLWPRDVNLKRVTGFVNWHKNRRGVYSRALLERLIADLMAQAPDHIAVTGDLVNIALPEEMVRAARWLEGLGTADRVSVLPGNHDLYCEIGGDAGIARWAEYMTGDAEIGVRAVGSDPLLAFPYLRRRGPVALIGVNSSLPRPPFVASGNVGAGQRSRLAGLLDRLGGEGAVRVVMIHHPPLPGQASAARGLDDAGALAELLARHGAELVIHGHNHRRMRAEVAQANAAGIPVIGAGAAALARAHKAETLASYHLYRLGTPGDGIEMIVRGLAEPDGAIVEL